MIFLAEAVVLCLVFSVTVIFSLLKDPVKWIGDYPPAIGERVKELGIAQNVINSESPQFWAGKILKGLFISLIFAAISVFINKASGFFQGFGIALGLWLIVTWFDALVIDCLWFCHSKKVKIKGTEDMKEYKDYMFHIKQSLWGSLMGIPFCLLSGLFTLLINAFMK